MEKRGLACGKRSFFIPFRNIIVIAPIFISPIRELEEFATDGNRTFRESVTSLSISTFLSIKGRRIYGRVGDRGGRI